MSDFERSGMTFDEPAKRRSPGTWFADLGDRLARGFNNFDRAPVDEGEVEWEYEQEEPEQPTAVVGGWDQDGWEPVDSDPNPSPDKKRFPSALHGYDRDAVDAHLGELERELAELRVHRAPATAVQAELERIGEETGAILKVAHQQAAEITRRAQTEADRCVADAAANAVAMTEEAKLKLRQLDSETDAVWAERGRLVEDVRNVATALFSLAEDAADRFPEDGDRHGTTESAPMMRAPAAPAHNAGPALAAAPGARPAPAAGSSTGPATAAAQHAGSPQTARPAQNPGPAPAPATLRNAPAPGAVPPPVGADRTGERNSGDLSPG